MAQQNTAAMAAANRAAAPQQQTRNIDLLKNMLSADSVQKQFQNALGKASGKFVASIIDLYNTDTSLQKCQPKQVIMEALKAAVLQLPINRQLGKAYVIAYNNTKRDEHGNWVKVYEPTFQIGYKGYIHLAIQSGLYRTINADVVYEGELRKISKLTGEISFDGERISDKVIGYFCYIEMVNGFRKTIYMTVEDMAKHAKRYSKSIATDSKVTVDSLIALSQLPTDVDSKSVGWTGNFHAMALKTVIRNLLSKYGYLSLDIAMAVSNDGDDTYDAAQDGKREAIPAVNVEDVNYEDVTTGTEPKQGEDDPGY